MNREIIVQSRGEGELVLDEMRRLLGQYGFVSVADFYTLIAYTTSYEQEKVGWRDLSGSEVVEVEGGWRICLPPTQKLFP